MKINASDYGHLKPDPIFKDLPDELKTLDKYEEIEGKIYLIMKSDHKHRKVKNFVECERCKVKRQKRNDLIRQYGFKNYGQYLQWKKVMRIIYRGEEFQVL